MEKRFAECKVVMMELYWKEKAIENEKKKETDVLYSYCFIGSTS